MFMRLTTMLAATALVATSSPETLPPAPAIVQLAGDGPECAAGERFDSSFGAPADVSVRLDRSTAFAANLLPSSGGPTPAAFRLSILASPGPSARWTLNIRDSGLRLLASFTPDDLRQRGSLWTGRFDVSQASAELIDADGAESVTVESAIVYDRQASGGSLFSTQTGTPNWKKLSEQGQLRYARAGDSVGMMVGSATDASLQHQSWCCSGAMLSPTLYITNWHCGGTRNVARSAFWRNCDSVLIDLAWDDGSRNRQYRCTQVLRANESLDYALLRVIPTRGRGGDDIPVRPVRAALSLPAGDQSAYLIHHPVCRPKRISLQNCRLGTRGLPAWRPGPDGNLPKSDMAHSCDTEAGSSGAPLFDAAGRMVGLHHLGFEVDGQCRPGKRENRAVMMRTILEDVLRNRPDLYDEIAPLD